MNVPDLIDLNILNIKSEKKYFDTVKNIVDYYNITVTGLLSVRDICQYSDNSDINLKIVLLIMFGFINNGSICFDLNDMKVLEKFNIVSLVSGFLDNYKKNMYDKIISDSDKQFKPLVLLNRNNKKLIYFHKYYVYEKQVSKFFKILFEKESDFIGINQIKSVTDKILIKNPVILEKQTLELSELQKTALFLSAMKPFLLVSGGPGTGKTSLIFSMLRLFLNLDYNPEKIFLAAPTGRAAQRIKESIIELYSKINNSDKIDGKLTEIQTVTMHRLLKYNPFRNSFEFNENNKIEADIIIIDEMSMVDIIIMTDFLKAVKPETKLIMLGDKNQIPSVEAGNIMNDLIPENYKTSFSDDMINNMKKIDSKIDFNTYKNEENHILKDNIIILKDIFRSDKTIINLAERINTNSDNVYNLFQFVDYDSFDKSNPGLSFFDESHNNCFFIDIKDYNYKIVFYIIYHWIHQFFINNKVFQELCMKNFDFDNIDECTNKLNILFDIINNSKILTFLNKSYFGCNEINKYIKSVLNPDSILGMPIMITENNYSKNLFNGETGIILKNKNSELTGVFKKGNAFIFYPVEILPGFVSAYATTIHKSQGSEYNNVLLVLPSDTDNKLLCKQILYTGITRTKNNIFLLGTEKVLNKTINTDIIRTSNLSLN